jgi:transposase
MMAGMDGKRTPMSEKDIRRAHAMGLVAEGRRTLVSVATVLGVSYRQAKRIYRRYREEGPSGLVHRSVGRRSNRRIGEPVRQRAVELYREQYADFGPTLAAEKMAERDELEVNRETLRRWLIAEGLWKPKRQHRHYRSRRERRRQFGELVQFDGSHHQWFEDRADGCCLMNMVDDATGTTLAFLDEKETTVGAFRLLWAWIERYGIPQAVYCDRKNAYVLDREPTIAEQLAGITPRSPFETACQRLGIEVIVARSPQAKGRVERSHGVYQDRLVKELRLEGISEIAPANEYLNGTYIDTVNAKFAKPPVDPVDAHVPLLSNQCLANILCFTASRVVSEDYVVQFENSLYQIQKRRRRKPPAPGSQVMVHKWLDGSVHLFSNGKELQTERIQQPTRKEDAESVPA